MHLRARLMTPTQEEAPPATWKVWVGRAIAALAVLAVFYAVVRAAVMLAGLNCQRLSPDPDGTGATFGRVLVALRHRLAVDDSRRRRHRLQSASWRASPSRWRRSRLPFRRPRCFPSCCWC